MATIPEFLRTAGAGVRISEVQLEVDGWQTRPVVLTNDHPGSTSPPVEFSEVEWGKFVSACGRLQTALTELCSPNTAADLIMSEVQEMADWYEREVAIRKAAAASSAPHDDAPRGEG